MMKNDLYRKGWVLGIIVLFVGASVIPSISGNIRGSSKVEDVKDFESEKLQFDKNEVASSSLKADSVSPDDDVVQYPESVTLSSETSSVQEEVIMDKLASVPLFFTENKGQFPEKVLFQTHVSGATVYLCRDGVVSVFSREIEEESDEEHVRDSMILEDSKPSQMERLFIETKFVDANMNATIVGEDVLPHYNNYFIGNDPDKWYTNVPNYKSVWYKDIYPGIDLHYYGDGDSLKYDFIVYPEADPSVIRICYDGVEEVELTPDGDIGMQTRFGSVYEKTPVLYQEINGAIQDVSGRYEIREHGVFGFAVDGIYNPLYPLVIDPELVYSTYLGGTDYDYGYGIVVDDSGCAYVTGYTSSSDFPMVNAYDDSYNGDGDCFVTKLSASGDSLVYSTYLGGTGDDKGRGIAVDDSGCAYVTGQTWSFDFPTKNAYDDRLGGYYDCFVTKFSTAGDSLVYSTYLGGTIWDSWDDGWSIAVDGSGCAYVTGDTGSYDFPTVNAYDDSFNYGYDCFVTKFSTSGNSLIYSTYLGGTGTDYGRGIAVDDSGCAYVTGVTESSDFPTKNAYDDIYNGGYGDCFVTKFSTAGDSLVYSTYLGGTNYDKGWGIDADDSGCAYVTGYTRYSDFPTKNAYDDSYNGDGDCFVTKLSASGDSLVYSTYLGGTSFEAGYGIAVDDSGCAYVAGGTMSSDFPTKNAYDDSYNGGNLDCFITKFSTSGNLIVYSTYLGGTNDDGWFLSFGITVDDSGCAYVAGYTQSFDFPTVNAYDDSYNGGGDCFVTKFSSDSGNPDTVYVDDDFNSSTPGWNVTHFDKIQQGIDAVTENGTVYVYSGTYYENVVINKRINLIGENEDTTIIDGSGSGDVVYISADWVNISGFKIQYGFCGINLFCSNSSVFMNTIIHNIGSGIKLYFNNCSYSGCYNNVIGNSIYDNKYGIQLASSNNNIISGNIIISNEEGIRLRSISSSNTITGNKISSNNGHGICLSYYSNNNIIFHNNFINNTQNAYDECNNTWYNETLQEGNYWSDFDESSEGAYDNNTDGIVDTPYNVPGGNNQDRYPLMKPYPSTIYDGSLSGYVNDTYMNPIEGARVRVYFHGTYEENYSDSSGYYHVTNIPICNCSKNATASKEGYKTEWVLLGITENTTYDFVLMPLSCYPVLNGTQGEGEWFITPVNVTFIYDPEIVAKIYYRVGSGEWTLYTEPFVIYEQGEVVFCWYCIDFEGNPSEECWYVLRIDYTPPAIELTVEKIGFNKWKFTASAFDEISGVNRVEFYYADELLGEVTEAPYEWLYSGSYGENATAIVYDNAGNSAEDEKSVSSDLILRFRKTVVRVTADISESSDTKEQMHSYYCSS